MAEKFRFFDPVQLEDGTYDREYNAQEFTDYFRAIILTGVLKAAGDGLVVSSNGNNMQSTISTGIAFLEGRYYENDSPLLLTHDTEVLGNSRIDRIVIRLNKNPDKRYVKAFIKKGIASADPIPPVLTQDATVYEISLAQVRIVGGQTFIATNAVTDEREYAGSNIIPSYDENALAELTTRFNTHVDNSGIHVTPQKTAQWDNALQPNEFKPTVTMRNLGQSSAEAVYSLGIFQNSTAGESGFLQLTIPPDGFTGVIELEVISTFANSNASGGVKFISTIGALTTHFHTTPEHKLLFASNPFANDFYVIPWRHNEVGSIYIEIKKRGVHARNPIWVKIKATGFNSPWDMLKSGSHWFLASSLENSRHTDLFTSVSNGKAAIANAVTQKGVPTAADAEFATMAANILNLNGFATGSRTVSAGGALAVSGLTFQPKVVIAVNNTNGKHLYFENISTADGYVVSVMDYGIPTGVMGETQAFVRRRASVTITTTSFSIPVNEAGTYVYYVYGGI